VEVEFLKEFDLNEIVFDERIYPREAGPDYHVVCTYSEAMRTGAQFPPPVLANVGGKNVIVDGVHRIRAAKRLRLKKLPCQHLGEMKEIDAFAEAVKRNISNGKQLSLHEKLLAHEKLAEAGYKPQTITQIVKIRPSEIRRFIMERISRTDHDYVIGKSTLKRVPGWQGRKQSPIKIEEASILTGLSQRSLVEQLLVILRNGWVQKQDKTLVKLLRELYLLLRKQVQA
jgi:ParB-like chromosome segregation protein Spo0J